MRNKIVEIGDLCEQIRGVSYGGGDVLDQPQQGYRPILRANNIDNGSINFDDLVYVPERYISEKQKLKKDDIVIAASSGSIDVVGKAAQIDSDWEGSFGAFCKVLRPSSDVNPKYIAYYFKTPIYRKTISHLAAGANINNLRNEHLDKLQIALPEPATQKEVALLLSKAETVLEKRRQTIRLADEFLKSAFLEMFGDPSRNSKDWPIKKISDVLIASQYGTSKKSNNENRGYIILGMGNISYDGQIDLTRVNSVDLSEKEFEELKLVPGDIIFNRTNSTELVGKTACWNREEKAVLASYLIKLKLKSDVIPEFFAFLLNTSFYKNIFTQRCKKAVGQSNISPTLLREFEVFLPPKSRQQEFADLVQKVEKLKEKLKASETQLQNLFNSLMQRAFRGELNC